MVSSFKIRRILALLVAAILCASVSVLSNVTNSYAESVSKEYSSTAEEELAQKFEEGFEGLFSEVIEQSETGQYRVKSGYDGSFPGVSVQRAQEIALGFNLLKTMSEDKGAKEYVECVLKGLIPGAGILSISWGDVYIWIKQRSWGKLSRYLAKHVAKKELKHLVKLTPGGLAASIPLHMIKCAVWG